MLEGIAVKPVSLNGIAVTVGSVFHLKGAFIPSAVVLDLGCGMMTLYTHLNSHDLLVILYPL